MNLVQQQRLEQQLNLTLEMRQSLEILQLPIMELKELVEKEAEENPLLEVEVEESVREEKLENIETYESRMSEREDYIYEQQSTFEESSYESSYESGFESSGGGDDGSESTIDIVSKLAVKGESIFEKVLKEVGMMLESEEEKIIAEYIIGNIDKYGFLKTDVEDIADYIERAEKKRPDLDTVEGVRLMVMSMDPLGIGSKDIAEYVVLQLENMQQTDTDALAIEIVRDSFEEFSRKKIKEITRKHGISEEKLKKVYERVAKCNPYPLRGYSEAKGEEVVIPDVIIKENEGKYEVYLNDANIPRLKLNNEYYKELSKDKDAVEYLKERAMRVRTLARSIEQRNLTLFRVAQAIVDRQKMFLKRGEKYLKPLTLAEIGYELDLHESTLSRVVNGKYMETPRGLFEMKYFFSGKVETEDGKNMSIVAVQQMIKEIVEAEDRKKPYNDKEITEILEKKGLILSQRTVTNYREAIGILPTYLRKEI